MSCEICGSACQGRYCEPCGKEQTMDRHRSDGGCYAGADAKVCECTKCGTEYRFRGDGACPDCDARQRRYVRDVGPGDDRLREAQT